MASKSRDWELGAGARGKAEAFQSHGANSQPIRNIASTPIAHPARGWRERAAHLKYCRHAHCQSGTDPPATGPETIRFSCTFVHNRARMRFIGRLRGNSVA